MRSTRSVMLALRCAASASPAYAQLLLGSAPDREPNNNTAAGANGVALGSGRASQSVMNLAPGDIDFVSIYGGFISALDSYVIVTTPLETGGAAADTVVEVLHPTTNNVLIADDDAGIEFPAGLNRGSALRFFASIPDSYPIRIRGFNAASSGNYLLSVAQVNLANSDLDGDWFDPFESSTIAAPSVFAVRHRPVMLGFGQADTSADVDVAAVDLDRGDLFVVCAFGISGLNANFSTPDMSVAMLDTNGSTVLVNNIDDAGGDLPGGTNTGKAGTVRFRAPETGRYYVRFTASGTGFYAVLTSFVPADNCAGDADGNGAVTFTDITTVLANFGSICP